MGEMEDALYEAGPMKRQDSQEFCLLSRCDMISEDFLVSSSTKITNSQIFYGKRADGASSGCWFAPKCVYLPRLYDYDGVLGQNDDIYGVLCVYYVLLSMCIDCQSQVGGLLSEPVWTIN